MKTLGFIGGGRVTRIILQGLRNQGLATEGVFVYDPNQDVLDRLVSDFEGIHASAHSLKEAAEAEILFLAVHPPAIMDAIASCKPYIKTESMIVSLAPKITMEKIRTLLGLHHNIARMNPSASSCINQGLNPINFSEGFSPVAKKELLNLLGGLGSLPEVAESKIEGYAIISAMGPTYFWFQLQKLMEMAVDFGLDPGEAREVIRTMMQGTVNTLLDSGLAFDQVTDLIPVKPMAGAEGAIKGYYDEFLPPLFAKIKPA
jgi:pyrroline-5-carboxylate reductase